jgi:hypothetical protein
MRYRNPSLDQKEKYLIHDQFIKENNKEAQKHKDIIEYSDNKVQDIELKK